MKYIILASLALALTACGDKHNILTVRTRVEVMLPPPEITGNCPSEIERVSATGVQGRYTEEETGEVAKRNRVAYVQCRTVVDDLKRYYADQKIEMEKNNPKTAQ